VVQSERESRRLWMLHQFKYYGSRNSKNDAYQIWTNSNHPEECFSEEFTYIKMNYIHENPVRAGIVKKAEDYIHSSAANYAGLEGIVDIEVI
jgi:putative transposase